MGGSLSSRTFGIFRRSTGEAAVRGAEVAVLGAEVVVPGGMGLRASSTFGHDGSIEEIKKIKSLDLSLFSSGMRQRVLLLRERLGITQYPDEDTSVRVGISMLWAGMTLQASLCLENALIGYESKCSPNHVMVGYICRDLGTCYLDRAHQNISSDVFDMVLRGSSTLDEALTCYHPDAILACQNCVYAATILSKFYVAINLQHEIIRRWSKFGQYGPQHLVEAQRNLTKARRYMLLLEKENSGFYGRR